MIAYDFSKINSIIIVSRYKKGWQNSSILPTFFIHYLLNNDNSWIIK